MEIGAATAVLEGLAGRRPIEASPADVEGLLDAGLIRAMSDADRATAAAEVQDLDRLAAELRELRRQQDLGAGPKSLGSADPSASGPPSSALAERTYVLSELSRRKAELDALQPNRSTATFLGLTFEGRQTLRQLAVWRPRTGASTIEEFQKVMRQFTTYLEQTLVSAEAILRALGAPVASPNPNRGIALILAKSGQEPVSVANRYLAFQARAEGPAGPQSASIAAALLAISPWETAAVQATYDRFRASLADLGGGPQGPEGLAILSAYLASTWENADAAGIDRIRGVLAAVSDLAPLDLLALARSDLPLSELAPRLAQAQAAVARAGYASDDNGRSAAAVLAASSYPASSLADRFVAVDAALRTPFPGTPLPSALVASLGFDPPEGISLFHTCVGAITRGEYFDVTAEIDPLALLLECGFEPSSLGIGAPDGALRAMPAARGYYPYGLRCMYRTYGEYVRVHPIHFHYVPAFG